MHRIWDIARYWSKSADSNLPNLYLAPPLGMIWLEFHGDFWHQKARVPGLSHGVVIVILGLAVFVQLRLVTDRQTDGQTDRRTDRHTMTANTARTVKSDENWNLSPLLWMKYCVLGPSVRNSIAKKFEQNKTNANPTLTLTRILIPKLQSHENERQNGNDFRSHVISGPTPNNTIQSNCESTRSEYTMRIVWNAYGRSNLVKPSCIYGTATPTATAAVVFRRRR